MGIRYWQRRHLLAIYKRGRGAALLCALHSFFQVLSNKTLYRNGINCKQTNFNTVFFSRRKVEVGGFINKRELFT